MSENTASYPTGVVGAPRTPTDTSPLPRILEGNDATVITATVASGAALDPARTEPGAAQPEPITTISEPITDKPKPEAPGDNDITAVSEPVVSASEITSVGEANDITAVSEPVTDKPELGPTGTQPMPRVKLADTGILDEPVPPLENDPYPDVPSLRQRPGPAPDVAPAGVRPTVPASGPGRTYDYDDDGELRERKDIDKGKIKSLRAQFEDIYPQASWEISLHDSLPATAYTRWKEIWGQKEPDWRDSLLAAEQARQLDRVVASLDPIIQRAFDPKESRPPLPPQELDMLRSLYRNARMALETQLAGQPQETHPDGGIVYTHLGAKTHDRIIHLDTLDPEKTTKVEYDGKIVDGLKENWETTINSLTEEEIIKRTQLVSEVLTTIADQWWEDAAPWIEGGMQGLIPKEPTLGDHLAAGRDAVTTAWVDGRKVVTDWAGQILADVGRRIEEASEERRARTTAADKAELSGETSTTGESAPRGRQWLSRLRSLPAMLRREEIDEDRFDDFDAGDESELEERHPLHDVLAWIPVRPRDPSDPVPTPTEPPPSKTASVDQRALLAQSRLAARGIVGQVRKR